MIDAGQFTLHATFLAQPDKVEEMKTITRESFALTRETPGLLGNTDIEPLLRDIADGLAEWDSAAALGERLEAIIGRMACHGSVRSGRRLRIDEKTVPCLQR